MERKTWTLRFSAKDIEDFQALADGRKTVETRAATPKYLKVAKGDTLVIVCGTKKLARTVKRVRTFTSLAALFKAVPFRKIMPHAATPAEARKIYYGYPGYREKLKKFGVIAFDI